MPTKLFFCQSTGLDPYWNIATENYLGPALSTAFGTAEPQSAVMLYLWRNARTVVIGQNQNPFVECDLQAIDADGGHLVRRTTGGGAVYHDEQNLNFSFVATPDVADLDRQFLVVARALESFNLIVERSGRNDITCNGLKISGNAFSHAATHHLHHGTLLVGGNPEEMQRYLKPNASKLRRHGVDSVRSRVGYLSQWAPINTENLSTALFNAFVEVYGGQPQTLPFLSLCQHPQVRQIHDRMCNSQWLLGKWKTFTAKRSEHFSWGLVAIDMQINEQSGIISSVDFATDALNLSAIESARTLLSGASITQIPEIPKSLDTDSAAVVSDILSLVYSQS